MSPRALVSAAFLLASAAIAVPAGAQIGSSTDIITGVVVNSEGQPVEDATIEAYSLETQVTRRARTDARGRFVILFPDGGGQYRMTARAIGLAPRIEVIQRHADEDRLVWNVRLSGGAVTLEGIEVRAGSQLLRGPDGPTPGSTERILGPDQLTRLPIDNTDLNALVGLVPGVVPISASDTAPGSYSVAGLGPDANALTLDGLLFGTATVPQEALRQTRVVTSTYDVSRGQFSGGLIASTTRSGSNVVQGSSSYQLRDDDLALTGEESQFAQGFTQHVISGGLGGPLVRDRLFIFGSLMSRLRDDPQQNLLSAGSADYTRLGVHPDSVARFLTIVDSLGVPPALVGSGGTRSNNTLSALVRLDWVLNNAHTLTLRGDWQGASQDPARLGSLALPQTGGQLTTGGGGLMATLTSRFGAAVINEFRGYWNASRRDGEAYARLPQGRVVVASDLPDGTRGVSTLLFGGNTGFPTRNRTRAVEIADELSWMPGTGSHRFKFGGFLRSESTDDIVGTNQLGTFTYSSLASLASGSASSFRRTVDVTERASRNYRWGLFAGDVWIVRRPFQLTYGVRLEGSSFGALPPYNPAIDTAFGRRTDRLPSEVHLSPRVGFSWTLGGARAGPDRFAIIGPPTTVIRGGIGEFRNQPPTMLASQARAGTGLAESTGEVFCVGSAVPAQRWDLYRLDPSTIPDECASSGPPGPAPALPPRTVIVLADGFEASRAWRGSLAVERRLTQLLRLTIEGSVSRGIRQSGFYDLNLDATPAFTLADEANRPVFVAPSEISAGGEPRFSASRRDTAFGSVLEVRSNLRSRTEQLTLGIGGILGRGIFLNLSYTYQRSRDQSTGLRGAGTAADPNVVEWARSDFERRHSFLATVTYPFSQSLELTSIARVSSGAPFTPMVSGDVNGDGSRNDRAFVFAPGASDPVARGMQNLLATASASVRECLERQLGAVAARNSCLGPWQASLDFQLNWRPAGLGLNRRLTLSLVTQNFLRGLDELVHGTANARGWGIATRPDNTLLHITGFDAGAGRYSYQVNERFGSTAGTATAFRPPFQIGVQMRMQIGPDRMRQALDAIRAGGRGGVVAMGPGGALEMGGQLGFRGPDINPAAIIERIASALPNPAATALELRDSLRLDSTQVRLLVPLRDSLARRNGERLDSLRRAVSGMGNNPSPGELMRLMPAMRPLFEAARNEIASSLVTVRAILTAEQWQAMPESVRNFQLPGPRMMVRPRP